jgi:hypothetical protein
LTGINGINADEYLSDNRGGFVGNGSYSLAGIVADKTPRE